MDLWRITGSQHLEIGLAPPDAGDCPVCCQENVELRDRRAGTRASLNVAVWSNDNDFEGVGVEMADESTVLAGRLDGCADVTFARFPHDQALALCGSVRT